MPALASYDYAIIQVVARAERGESANAGVVMHCLELAFLEARVHLDERRLLAFWPNLDPDPIRQHLEAFPRICAAHPDAGPIARLSRRERFQWLVAPRSTVIQVSAVHSGVSDNPQETLNELFRRLVLV